MPTNQSHLRLFRMGWGWPIMSAHRYRPTHNDDDNETMAYCKLCSRTAQHNRLFLCTTAAVRTRLISFSTVCVCLWVCTMFVSLFSSPSSPFAFELGRVRIRACYCAIFVRYVTRMIRLLYAVTCVMFVRMLFVLCVRQHSNGVHSIQISIGQHSRHVNDTPKQGDMYAAVIPRAPANAQQNMHSIYTGTRVE